ncbi:unnamed protein product [Blepharisma stoltei]|uniref:Thioredoxin domain-containing protein n=1 Tax=Blepharisma stoltei TaxID=1481888 RepID=A0AAU9JAE6_9CILI|nr:unnamed protein product [Blepharisma stoltei]
MENYLGSNLKLGESEVTTSELKNKGMVLLYFSASWSYPCRRFTSILKEFYEKVNKVDREIEIVFISCDLNEEQFNEYYGTMPWYALPFEEQGIKDIVTRHYEVSGIPQLILVNECGGVVSDSCRLDIMSKDSSDCILYWRDKIQSRSSIMML